MNKFTKIFLTLILSLMMLAGGAMSVFAASATMTGPGTVRAGDIITVKLNVAHSGSLGVSGTLEYDSAQVGLSGTPTAGLNGWVIDNNGKEYVIYDDKQQTPVSGTKTVITMKFKVKDNVAAGTKITISFKNLTSSDGTQDTSLGTASYTVTVAKPLSGNNNLSALSVNGYNLSPAFNASTTSYDIGTVPFSVKALDIKYTAADVNAKVSISGNSLNVGNNTVSVVVKAENGSSKTYKIKVNRQQDPNYVADTNANLKAITVDKGILSPVFKADISSYIVYLPYETVGTAFTANGTAESAKAQSVTAGKIEALEEGKNQTTVSCKAENGTEKVYTIMVYVMPLYDGNIPAIGEGNPGGTDVPVVPEEPSDTEESSESEMPSEAPENSESQSEKTDAPASSPKGGSGIVTVLLILLVLALAGALVYVVFIYKR